MTLVDVAVPQSAASYDPQRWANNFEGLLDHTFVETVLMDPEVSVAGTGKYWSVDRDNLHRVAAGMDLANDEQVMKVFLLMLAWGNGTNSRWGFQNARMALEASDHAVGKLSRSAQQVRGAHDVGDLADAYRSWNVKHISGSFFTKWFTFAGDVEGRAWQPLILDENVTRTLEGTLGTPLRTLTDIAGDAEHYVAYVSAVHEAAATELLTGVSAQQIEYALFKQDGAPLPSAA